jgi:hypothetical protein
MALSGWYWVLSLQKEGEFTLHGRAILEMEQHIREVHPDAVKTCSICHGLLVQVLWVSMSSYAWALFLGVPAGGLPWQPS